MIYCTKCGKENSDAAKFCTGCGATLKAKQAVANQTANPPENDQIKRKKANWIAIGGVASLLLAVAVYFLFFYKSKPVDKNSGNNTVERDTIITQTTPVKVSDPIPLKPTVKENEITISQSEVDNVSRHIQEFYTYENSEDVTNLLSYYRFPLDRYYQLNNVSYDKLHKMVTEAYNGKLYYHNINIKWNYCSVQKISPGVYKTLLFAEYSSGSQGATDRKTNEIHLIILMNDKYEITSIYPN